MPSWKTHLIFSLFLVVVWMSVFNFLGISLNWPAVAILLIFTTFSSLFPDIDMKRSKIRDIFAVATAALVSAIYLIFFAGVWYYAFAYFLLLYFILKYLPAKHRGITHSILFSTMFSFAMTFVYFIFNPFTLEQFVFWFVVVFVSYNLHLVIDKV